VIPKEQSLAIFRRSTANTMARRKMAKDRQ